MKEKNININRNPKTRNSTVFNNDNVGQLTNKKFIESQNIQKLLHSLQWNLKNIPYYKQQAQFSQAIFLRLKETDIEFLQLNCLWNHPDIFLLITCKYSLDLLKVYQNKAMRFDYNFIKFTKLQQLWLAENKIKSLEPITFLCAPQLKIIHLQQNQINRTQSLKKCNFKFLERIELSNNPIYIMTNLQKVRFNSDKKISELFFWPNKNPYEFHKPSQNQRVLYWHHNYEKPFAHERYLSHAKNQQYQTLMLQDMSKLVKIEAVQIKQLSNLQIKHNLDIKLNRRINQQIRIYRMLRKRFKRFFMTTANFYEPEPRVIEYSYRDIKFLQ